MWRADRTAAPRPFLSTSTAVRRSDVTPDAASAAPSVFTFTEFSVGTGTADQDEQGVAYWFDELERLVSAK